MHVSIVARQRNFQADGNCFANLIDALIDDEQRAKRNEIRGATRRDALTATILRERTETAESRVSLPSS